MPGNELQPQHWVERYADYLVAIARMKLRDDDLAKDLVGETFLSALQARNSFRGESSEKTWLVRILNNKIIDQYRKNTPQNTTEYLSETDKEFYQEFFEPTRFSEHHWKEEVYPTNDQSFTEQWIEREEFSSILEWCIRKLPKQMRPVFVAKYLEETESEEICKEYQLSSSNYWVLIHRARLLMRSCLEKNWLK